MTDYSNYPHYFSAPEIPNKAEYHRLCLRILPFRSQILIPHRCPLPVSRLMNSQAPGYIARNLSHPSSWNLPSASSSNTNRPLREGFRLLLWSLDRKPSHFLTGDSPSQNRDQVL